MQDEYPYLGQGWEFPPTFDPQRGEAALVSGFEDINQSLKIILTTQLGERLMRPQFGCALDRYVFDVINNGAVGFLQHMIETAIVYHEARIDVEQVGLEFDATKGVLLIEIKYRLRNANSRFNFVFPYYLEEANTKQ